MKQQFTGSYTLDVASRTIVLSGIEIPQARLAVVINSTVGFVYHNIEHDPTATVSVLGGDTTIVFPRYKDCETHRNTDALSIFYDDGVDLGQLIKDESDETQALLTAFKDESKAESDETQAILQAEFDDTQTPLSDFKAEAKAESDGTQALLQAEFDETQTLLSDFKTEAKSESDDTQALLQAKFDETQTILTGFKDEAKIESDEAQNLLQSELDEMQAAIPPFQAEVKTAADELQTLLGGKLPDLAQGMVPAEFLNLFEAPNDVDVDFVPGGYGPARIIYRRNGATLRAVNLHYGDSGDALGKLVLVTPFLWTPAELTTRNAWFDASFANSITEAGGEISIWGDRTSNGFTLITPSGVPAPRVGALLSDRPTISFDAGGNYLQSILNGDRRSLTNLDRDTVYPEEAIFIVVRNKSDAYGTWLFSQGNIIDAGISYRSIVDGAAPDRLLWRSSGISADQVRYDTPGWSGASESHLLSFFVSATSQIFEAGQLVGQTPVTGTRRAGRWDQIGLNSNADFAEMLFLSEVPDEPTRQRIEGYLAHKWGLAAQLPALHPYRFSPPGI